MQDIFAREEKKILLSKEQYNILKGLISEYLMKDEYHRYKICNIYYDTKEYDLFRISADKPIYKEKLRLRSYGNPTLSDNVFLEIKKKYDGIVYKRRIQAPLSETYRLIEEKEFKGETKKNNPININEIENFLSRYNVEPKVYLSYEREAYSWKSDDNFRITFDTNIKYRTNNVGLEKGDDGEMIFKDDRVLMEIKSLNNLPIEFTRALQTINATFTSFSKIGYVYKEYILPKIRAKYELAAEYAMETNQKIETVKISDTQKYTINKNKKQKIYDTLVLQIERIKHNKKKVEAKAIWWTQY